jgi:hypothetical protein
MTTRFSYRSSRSGGLVLGLAMAIGVETIALHALFMRSHPWVAWTLTLTSVYALWWIVSDYRAMGTGAVAVSDAVQLDVGRRVHARFTLADIAGVSRPTWRERPTRAADYLNATKPAEPNVLITLKTPATARLAGGVRRSVQRIGLHVDDPAAMVAALSSHTEVS